MANQNTCGLHQLRVFIVDDNEHMRILLRTILRAMGVSMLYEFADGGSALAQLGTMLPDFVLTDLSMAPMDGLTFAKTLRQLPDENARVIPIIMVTGHTERRQIEAARDAGVNEILAKPINTQGLYNRIEQIIYRPRPFVRSPNYFGPCRRRQKKTDYTGPFRRKTDQDERNQVDVEAAPEGGALTPGKAPVLNRAGSKEPA
jgi:CheY-like chemotaxis protein